MSLCFPQARAADAAAHAPLSQWVWCKLCCKCAGDKRPNQERGCTNKAHWFERDAFDTGRRNHLKAAHSELPSLANHDQKLLSLLGAAKSLGTITARLNLGMAVANQG